MAEKPLIYNHNGSLVSDFRLEPQNRAFAYGDGFFESIIAKNTGCLFLDLHLKRILDGLKAYEFEGGFMSIDELNQAIQQLMKANSLTEARAKIYFWRESKGLYLPYDNFFSYLIEVRPLLINPTAALHVGISEDWRVQPNKLSGFKSMSSIVYVMAAKEARQKNWDDIILLDHKERIVESSRSNVFWINEKDTIFTPELSLGCIRGIRRRVVIDKLRAKNLKIIEISAYKEELAQAKSIFLTNVSGCYNIDYFEGNKLQHTDLSALGL